MARSIKIGDEVRAFLNAAIEGTVVDFIEANNSTWTQDGTLNAKKVLCLVKLKSDGSLIKVPKSELFIKKY